MPTVSPYGTCPVVMGPQTGGGTVSIMGGVPAAMSGATANAARWFTSAEIIVQDYTSGAVLKTYDTGTLTYTQVDAAGANLLGGGGGVWAAQLGGSGTRTSVMGCGPFPLAGIPQVSEVGQIAVVMNYGTASGITVYNSSGTAILSISASLAANYLRLRQNILAYLDSTGWHLIDVRTGGTVDGWKPRPAISFLVPFTIGGTVGVLEYDSSADPLKALSVRPANRLNGLIIPTTGHEFNVDVQGVDASHVRVAWSLTPAEAPADLVILDINTATGATNKGTVSGSTVVFATGPTLAGSTFSGSQSGSIALPVQLQPVVMKDGTITKPWRDALSAVGSAATGAITAIQNLPIIKPNPNTVIGKPPSTDKALARWDGTSGTQLQDSVAGLSDAGALSGITNEVIDGSGSPQSPLIVQNIASGGLIADNPASVTDASVLLQAYVINTGDWIPVANTIGYLWVEDGTSKGVGLEVQYSQTPNTPIPFTNGIGLTVNAPNSDGPTGLHSYQYGGLGAGAVSGLIFRLDRNDSGSGAASAFNPQRRDGTNDYLWTDSGGTLRAGPAAPTENNSVRDTSGLEVANQTFAHAMLLGGM